MGVGSSCCGCGPPELTRTSVHGYGDGGPVGQLLAQDGRAHRDLAVLDDVPGAEIAGSDLVETIG